MTSIILIAGCTYISRGNNFIENVSNATGQEYVVSVILLKNGKITKLKDLDSSKKLEYLMKRILLRLLKP